MTFTFDEATHVYRLDGKVIPSLTRMLNQDGWNEHLKNAPPDVVKAKAEWGTRLHNVLSYVEYGYEEMVTPDFKPHCDKWMDVVRRMKWHDPLPVWQKCELPVLGKYQGFVWGFIPDRASPAAVVELKGTYSPHVSHSLQTALQVIGMDYPRTTPRYVAYFDKQGFKVLHHCKDAYTHNGITYNVFDEAERIIFEYAEAL